MSKQPSGQTASRRQCGPGKDASLGRRAMRPRTPASSPGTPGMSPHRQYPPGSTSSSACPLSGSGRGGCRASSESPAPPHLPCSLCFSSGRRRRRRRGPGGRPLRRRRPVHVAARQQHPRKDRRHRPGVDLSALHHHPPGHITAVVNNSTMTSSGLSIHESSDSA